MDVGGTPYFSEIHETNEDEDAVLIGEAVKHVPFHFYRSRRKGPKPDGAKRESSARNSQPLARSL